MKQVIYFESEDGSIWNNAEECAKRDGLVLCPRCKGTLTKTIKVPYPKGLPDSGWVDATDKDVPCDDCISGYVTKSQLDEYKEYELYLKLKKKYN